MRCGITISVMAILAGCQGSGIEGYTLPEPTDVTDLSEWDFGTVPDAIEDDVRDLVTPDADLEETDATLGEPFLAPCDEDSDCESGICVEHLGEEVCGGGCEACPPGWTCKLVVMDDGTTVETCISIHANLCKPCMDDDDCTSPGDQQDLCLDYDGTGWFCGGYCQVDADCPDGYLCEELPGADDSTSRQCIRYAGECPCSDTSAELGLATICTLSNEHGSCPGSRTCTDEGLSPCEGTPPAPDLCNGLDDDCDGDTDEEPCDDDNPCTDDTCDGPLGCLHAENTQACDDGNLCTTNDTCSQGTCVAGDALPCEDQIPCTLDACDPAAGCTYEPDDAACDDQVPCTVDSCDPAAGCTTVPDDGACDDGIPCTTNACDPEAGCSNEPDDSACDDGISCTTDTCVVDEGCVLNPEPVDCVVGEWGPWGDCDVACGDGLRARTREVLVEPGCGGMACPPLQESEPCSEPPCPLDCVVSEWSPWSDCTGPCDAGSHSRSRTIIQEPEPGGAPCPPLEETDTCSMEGLPCTDGVSCTLEDICSAGACLGVAVDAACDDDLDCTTETCDPEEGCVYDGLGQDCAVSEWSPWGPCDADCGGGLRTRTRVVLVEPGCGGAACPELVETEPCNTEECVPVDCEVGPWSPWGPCNLPCGDGSRSRTREIVKNPMWGGAACPDLVESESCDTEGLPCTDGDPCTPTTTCQGDACTGPEVLVCGDGLVCGEEECDDGNQSPWDGCKPPCVISEFLVNQWTPLNQTRPAVAALAGGGFAAAWASEGQDGSGTAVYTRLYGPGGAPAGNEDQANMGWDDDQIDPVIVGLAGGGFVTIWQSAHLLGQGLDIFGQRYDLDGQHAGDEFQVNDETLLDQDNPDVIATGDGFMVVWEDHDDDGESLGIYARRFSGQDYEPGPVIPVYVPVDGNWGKWPAIASLSDGTVVVAWHQSPSGANGFRVIAQRMDANGQLLGQSFQVNTDEEGPLNDVAMVGLVDGGFVVAWSSFLQDGASWGVYGQRYDATVAKAGGEFQVNVTTADAQEKPAVAALTDGGYVVSWQSMLQDGDDWTVVLRQYAADGTAGPELLAATVTENGQGTPALAPRFGGGWVVLWASGGGQDGAGYGIYGQLYEGDGSKSIPIP